jgi:hypothetical protein
MSLLPYSVKVFISIVTISEEVVGNLEGNWIYGKEQAQ